MEHINTFEDAIKDTMVNHTQNRVEYRDYTITTEIVVKKDNYKYIKVVLYYNGVVEDEAYWTIHDHDVKDVLAYVNGFIDIQLSIYGHGNTVF